MEYNFTDTDFDKKLLERAEAGEINPFLLENNVKQVSKIYDFLAGNGQFLLVSGFLGTGKTAVVEHTLKFLSDSCIVLRYNCFETTILDDILLEFFDEFKKLTTMGKITQPKSKSENFTQKITSYFESVGKPIVIVINSFEAIIKHNRPEILDFIYHLENFENVKVILIARTFAAKKTNNKSKEDTNTEAPSKAKEINNETQENNEEEELNVELKPDLKCEKVKILALQKSVFEKYLRANDQKKIGPVTDEFYIKTKGYFLYINLALMVMKVHNLRMIDLFDIHSKSFLSFSDYILREGLALIDPVSGHLLRFLTIMRHPVNIKLLKSINLYNEAKVNLFIENHIFSKDGEYIYLQDYYKDIAQNSIPENVAIKLHQNCIELYNTQLPLRPLERDLLISRQTMRNEIEYHTLFVPQKPVLQHKNVILNEAPVKEHEDVISTKEQKDEKIKQISFIFDDDTTGLLDKIAESILDVVDKGEKLLEEENEENTMSLSELITKAKQKEIEFEYNHAISLYLKALIHKQDDDYYLWLPTIYTKLAINYKNISNWFDAQKYLELAEEFYTTAGNIEKILETKFEIANIYYMTFKHQQAKDLFIEIERSTNSNELRIKTLNALATLTTNSELAYNYLIKALETNTQNVDKSVLSELYFKFAVSCEETGRDKIAFEAYKKCITLDLKPNPYLSSAFSNIAMMYDDAGKSDLAIKYYKESLKIDINTDNLNGIYSSYMKLAEIYSAKAPANAIDCYKKALNYAKELKEPFYIVSTATATGDFYFNRKEIESALKYYKIALKYAKSKENTEKINTRIKDIKILLGDERFNELGK